MTKPYSRSAILCFVLLLGTACTTAEAACTDADLCTLEQCQARQAAVHPTCDRPRACNASMDRATLTAMRFRSEECLSARINVRACFSQSDQGHSDAIDAVMRSIEKCDDLLDD